MEARSIGSALDAPGVASCAAVRNGHPASRIVSTTSVPRRGIIRYSLRTARSIDTEERLRIFRAIRYTLLCPAASRKESATDAAVWVLIRRRGNLLCLIRRTHRKPFEGHVEPGSVRCSAHRPDQERPGIRQAAQAQQLLGLTVDGVAHLDVRPGPADPQPEGAGIAPQRCDRPVRLLPGDNGAGVLTAVDKLHPAFEPDPVVETDHQSRLVVPLPVGAADGDSGDEIAVPRPEPEMTCV